MSNLDLTGLDDFGSFIDPENSPKSSNGKPLEIEIEKIIEDKNQPRVVFDDEAMKELADSIKARGVKTPISVRPSPDDNEQFVINHGARRFRAAREAGLKTIPAFIDNDYLFTDQLVENLQRKDLTLKETVSAIQKLLDDGMSQKDIAKETGKSRGWVSQMAGVVRLNERIKAVMESEKCQDFTALNKLNDCFEIDAEATIQFIDEHEAITRGDVDQLRKKIDGETDEAQIDIEDSFYESESEALGSDDNINTLDGVDDAPYYGDGDETLDSFDDDETHTSGDEYLNEKEKEPKFSKPQVQVKVDGREAVILLKKPAEYGVVWVEFEDGSEEAISAANVDLVAIIETK